MHSRISFPSVGIAGLLASCALGACSNGGDEGLIITKNVAVMDIAGACTFTGDPNEPFLSAGVVDTHAGGYLLNPQIQSRIVADTVDDPTTMLQRTVLLTDGDIDVTFPDGTFTQADFSPATLTHFKQLVTGPVAPNGGSTDTSIEVISGDLIAAIVAKNPTLPLQLQISLVVHGTMSGTTVSSQKFDYPVSLVSGLARTDGPCPLPSGTMLTNPGNPCNAFQDAPVDCCTQADNSLLCPASIATM